MSSIANDIDEAIKCGRSIKLDGIHYGAKVAAPAYYEFLAGFCHAHKIARVLEIGTFRGGSASAMHAGILSHGAEPLIVTVDMEKRDTSQIDSKPHIHKFIGDPLALPNSTQIFELFGHKPVDLIFLDTTKQGRVVMNHFAMFSVLLQPRFIIMDDITLNPTMQRMWSLIEQRFGENAVNLGMTHPDIRKQGELNPEVKRHPGFGLVKCV